MNIEDKIAVSLWIILNGWMVLYQVRLLRYTRLAIPSLKPQARALAKKKQVSLRWRFAAILADLVIGVLSIDPPFIGTNVYTQLFLGVFLFGAWVLFRNSRSDYREIINLVEDQKAQELTP